MRILEWRVPPYDNGTYIVHDERRDALVIDPAMGERDVIAAAKEHKLRVVEILNTHGHPDHIYGNAAVKEATRARLAIHRAAAYRLGPTRPPTRLQRVGILPARGRWASAARMTRGAGGCASYRAWTTGAATSSSCRADPR